MNQEDQILSLLLGEWDRRERIQHRLGVPNLAFALLKRFKELYNTSTGSKVQVTGHLTQRKGQFFIEMPPRELLRFYPEVMTPLVLPARFRVSPCPSIGTLASFKGTIRVFRCSELRPFSQIKWRKILEVDDWHDNYRDIYLECPISLQETLKLIREKLEPSYPLDIALLFSPISAPSTFNTTGGVSTLLSATTLCYSELRDIGRFLQNLVPSWHHRLSKAGFSFPIYNNLDSRLVTILKVRKNPALEFSPLVTRSGAIDLETECGFFELDDPIVLERSTVTFNDSLKEFEEFLPEIQWSIMSSHLWLTEITERELPPSFDKIYANWVEKMCTEFSFFNDLHISSPSSLLGINGRKGGLLRLMGSLARLNESLINNEIMNETFNIATKLFEEFNLAHSSTFKHYERDPHSPYYGQSKSRKIRLWQNAIFDIIRSEGFIARNQIVSEAEKLNLIQNQMNRLFKEMVARGKLYEFRPNKYKMP